MVSSDGRGEGMHVRTPSKPSPTLYMLIHVYSCILYGFGQSANGQKFIQTLCYQHFNMCQEHIDYYIPWGMGQSILLRNRTIERGRDLVT